MLPVVWALTPCPFVWNRRVYLGDGLATLQDLKVVQGESGYLSQIHLAAHVADLVDLVLQG